ncbi:hypothetical protein V502_00173 [Pseudogymnoascus sp. VKM F-4520 (FW-2644)]|nr:hypothetical protein V502_00173 [Pseudogymnoascus sp. VKM F-4520 (FW-2644)]
MAAKPSVLLSKVPSTQDIYESLGFRGSRHKASFSRLGLEWRRSYITSDGRPGTQLIFWNSPIEQNELKLIAEGLLSRLKTPAKFWRIMKKTSSSDREIVELMKQLLWRENRCAVKNANSNDKIRLSQKRPECISYTQDYGRQTKRQKTADATYQGLNRGFMEGSGEERLPSQQSNPLAPLRIMEGALPPTKPKSPLCVPHKRQIPIYIILTRSGGEISNHRFWEGGRFGSKSLDEFLPSLAAKVKCEQDDIRSIKLVLRLQTLDVEIEVQAGSKAIWEMMKVHFRNEIKGASARGERKEVTRVLVKPLMWKDGPNPGE